MHLDFASALNLVSTIAIVGALIFIALQVRAASRAARSSGDHSDSNHPERELDARAGCHLHVTG
jgi:hypothetical protein